MGRRWPKDSGSEDREPASYVHLDISSLLFLWQKQRLAADMFCWSARQFIDKQLDLDAAFYQVRLELVEINVQSSVKSVGNIVQMKQERRCHLPQRGCDGGDDLGDQPVEVGVGGPADLQVVLTKVVDCLQG